MSDTMILVGLAASGWTAFISVVTYHNRMISRGDIITTREANSMQKRIDFLEAALNTVNAQNKIMISEGLPLTNTVVSAVNKLVESHEQ